MTISGTQQEWNRAYDNVNNRRNDWNGGVHADSEQFAAISKWSGPLPPARQWFYGHHYIKGSLSSTVADGGVGKTPLAVVDAIAMATGRPLLDIPPLRRCRVLYWNGEEPPDDIRRRVRAACQYYRVDSIELDECLFGISGLEHPINASDERGGLAELRWFLQENLIEVAIIDPFVAAHRAPENDNTAVDAIAKRFAALANELRISIEIVHHTRKPSHGEPDTYTVHDSRGGVALTNATRAVRVLNRMSEGDAAAAGITNRHAYVRIEHGKANYAARDPVQWLKLCSETLDNFDGTYGPDSVGVVAAWRFPGAFDGVSQVHLDEVCELF